jgi:hypothetical protein
MYALFVVYFLLFFLLNIVDIEAHRVSVVSLHYSLDTLRRPLGACEHSNRANDGEPPSRLCKIETGICVKTASGSSIAMLKC